MDWMLSKCRDYNDFEITDSTYLIKLRQYDAFTWKVRLYKVKEKLFEKQFMWGFRAMALIKKIMENVEEIASKEKENKLERKMLSEKYIKEMLDLKEIEQKMVQ